MDGSSFVFEFTFEGETIAFPGCSFLVSQAVKGKEPNVVSRQFVFWTNVP
jgi:hypothetical protein